MTTRNRYSRNGRLGQSNLGRSEFSSFNKDFDKSFKRTQRTVIGAGVFFGVLYLAFWAFIVAVIVLVLMHFGII